MKKVYIPTEQDLRSLEKLGVNTYYYLITKVVESLVMADTIYEEEDMFEVAYDDFSDIPQIIYAIARMYPERIVESQRASNDAKLCEKIIPTLVKNDKSIYGLDLMNNFSETVLQNKKVLENIIDTLARELQKSPRYRFEYKGPNDTLDQIFACEMDTRDMDMETFKTLAELEPIYLTKKQEGIILPEEASLAITRYANTYGLHAYGVRATNLTTQINNNDRTKKLTRRLEQHKKYYEL